jgi:hypothetical protein
VPQASQDAISAVLEAAEKALLDLHSAKSRDSFNLNVSQVPYVEPLLFKSLTQEQSKSDAVHFNMFDLTARILQHDSRAMVRLHQTPFPSTPPVPSCLPPRVRLSSPVASVAKEWTIAQSDEWKSRKFHNKMPEIVKDITDCRKARFSDLMRKAGPEEADVIRVLYQESNSPQ